MATPGSNSIDSTGVASQSTDTSATHNANATEPTANSTPETDTLTSATATQPPLTGTTEPSTSQQTTAESTHAQSTSTPTRSAPSVGGASTATTSTATSRRSNNPSSSHSVAPSAIPTPPSGFQRLAPGTSTSAAPSTTTTAPTTRLGVNSPRRVNAVPLASSSNNTQHVSQSTPAHGGSTSLDSSTASHSRAASSHQQQSQPVSSVLNTSSNHSMPTASTTRVNTTVPPMFGSYSGGPPSLFTIGTGGLTGPPIPRTPASLSSQDTPTNTTANVRLPNAGYWRAPARPSNAQNAASASGSFAFASATNNTARNALGTATASRQGWPLADPAGWAGSTLEVRRTGDFHENSLLSFSWTIQDLALLQEEVEKSPQLTDEGRSVSAGAGKSEIWTCHPIFGDGKWKLELIRTRRESAASYEHTSPLSDDEASNGTTVLSAYLTSMVLDYNSGDVTIPAQIMLGIKVPSPQPASHSRRKDWIWTYFTNYTFRREAEFFECHELPTLTSLLANPDIARANAIELVVQIGTGPRLASPTFGKEPGRSSSIDASSCNPFQMPDAQFVPNSMLRGLEGLLDDGTTGDVALIVRERGLVPLGARQHDQPTSGSSHHQDAGDWGFEVIPWPVGSAMPDPSRQRDAYDAAPHSVDAAANSTAQIVVRDRVIWAHSSILSSGSEYFRTMLESGFSEGQGLEETSEQSFTMPGGRRVRVLRIPDVDYTTAQALLRYLYTADIEYMDREDVRSASLDDEWMGRRTPIGNAANGQSSYGGSSPTPLPVWEWRSLAQIEADEAAADGGAQTGETDWPISPMTSHHGPRSPSNSSSVRHSTDPSSSSGHQSSRSMGRSSSSRLSSGHESSSGDTAVTSTNRPDGTARSMLQCLASDPHPHPSPAPCPASSLSVYRLAHRYNQTGLASRSKDHLVSSLRSSNAFPILLATHLYPDLYSSVQKFVLENWDSVSATREFERCCDEVSEGEWGIDAGRALRLFMRALTSPMAGSNRATPPGSSNASTHYSQQTPAMTSHSYARSGFTMGPRLR